MIRTHGDEIIASTRKTWPWSYGSYGSKLCTRPGKHTKSDGKSPFLMAIFNSYVKLPEGSPKYCGFCTKSDPFSGSIGGLMPISTYPTCPEQCPEPSVVLTPGCFFQICPSPSNQTVSRIPASSIMFSEICSTLW